MEVVKIGMVLVVNKKVELLCKNGCDGERSDQDKATVLCSVNCDCSDGG